jgi:hypothetical protein
MTGVTAKIAARRERAQEAKDRAAVESVRLGPESLAPAVPDAEVIEIARAAAVLGHETNDAFYTRETNDAFGNSDGL